MNPFTPNFGQIPRVMAGRDMLIDEIAGAFDNAPGDPCLTSILIGARGVGKTALLSLLSNEAQSRGWVAVDVPCVKGMLEEIVQGAVRASENLVDHERGTRLAGLSVRQLFGVEWENDAKIEPTWFIRMTAVLDALQEKGIGLVITVDEVRPSLDEMIQLASFYQLFIRGERKVSLLMAGLPAEVSSLLGNESVSFLRHASQYHIGRIDDCEIGRALQETAAQAGKKFDEDALRAAVEASGGFPFMMQLVGYRSWQAEGDGETLGFRSVELGVARATEDMKSRVLRSTLDELSSQDLEYLEAMLEDGASSSTSDIAKRIGKTDGYASQYRRRLIERGIIAPKGRGWVAFDLPMLREYLPEYLETR